MEPCDRDELALKRFVRGGGARGAGGTDGCRLIDMTDEVYLMSLHVLWGVC